ncbi:NAD(P)-dependent dehydrogenase, short-chain alcohol dehydrogenase family [Bradyrhizobium erythrophlei]|jgi:NAD(P)-dependent dehydrogenase (short-subunit alcohol dehydrogenase family)|nr:NAD(P)-dependent dehydrogenase, short-chain alcohol dehydrogenase family [Bradyrhizobium erythrophlei]
MSKKLEGKIAVVTGGSADIGLGAAKEFVVEGARVFITGRRQIELDRAVAEIGHNAIAIQGDASELPDIKRIYDTVNEKAGRIDVLFANAGFYEFQKFGEITEEHFDNTFGTNVGGPLFAVQGALPLLGKKSSVIFTGSIAANIGIPAMSVYSATKAAIRSFARSWILDLKGVLSPGRTVTPGPNKLKNDLIGTIPLGRLGTPLDLAKGAMFLASDESEYITSIELEVDGGEAQY